MNGLTEYVTIPMVCCIPTEVNRLAFLSSKNKRIAKNVAKTGAYTVSEVILLILKIIGTFLLICVTTGVVFACIFAMYIKLNYSSDLGYELEEFSLKQSSVVYYSDPETGAYKELVTLKSDEYRIWIDYEEIPKHVEHAVVAIEDKRFYKHNGVDWYRTSGAFVNMFLRSRDTFGGSTITQQLIKNLTGEDEGTVQRKLQEIFSALELEKKYEKDEIVEWYLNKVYFGNNCYGIAAAANYYFGKEVSELSVAEAASIVGITNNPSLYSPYMSRERNKERQEDILHEMYIQGYIDSEEEYQAAINEELVFMKDYEDEEDTGFYSWYVDALIEDVIADLMEIRNCSYDTANMLLFNGGYQIYSCIDMDIQNDVDQIYENLDEIPNVSGSSQQIQSAIVIIDPYTGDIAALSGGVGEKDGGRLYNRATRAKRPPGSSIKPISAYAPALEYRYITPETRFEDSEDVRLNGTTWMTRNDDWDYDGVVTIREALRKSINTVAAQLVDALSPAVSYNFVKDMAGLSTLDPLDLDYAPMALGQLTYGATVRDMASAYTMFVNSGIRSSGRTYSHICDADGQLIYENEVETVLAISEKTAYWMTDMLQGAATWGTGTEAALDNMPTAGKTGTTTDKKDRWFVGYTPYYVAAVWTGFDMPAPMSAYGNPAAQLWHKVMTLVHEDLEYKRFTVPDDTYLSPIPGVDPEVEYTVRGVTLLGEVLYEEVDDEIAEKEVTVTAQELENYTLVGPAEITITISKDPEENIITFTYVSTLIPDPPVDPDNPLNPDNPDNPNNPDIPGIDDSWLDDILNGFFN